MGFIALSDGDIVFLVRTTTQKTLKLGNDRDVADIRYYFAVVQNK
jgi:hypothetical protein